ncbi:pentatricopeptide repeat-containing protein 1, mitochondrial isoform X2 [Synchiropus splendidus]|uniref:pentatricopeptide repeat-containing protein 1, mitochondrial isoform X2 n=1 Tax=Synchiropus splendidus TaxID=270530 RepID=UPI00237EE909|nr:pentatricopeptide repeat-containing protein 1, mitochondrial isoform X2 [Synchiropus splendidus]
MLPAAARAGRRAALVCFAGVLRTGLTSARPCTSGRARARDPQDDGGQRAGRRNTPYWYFLQCKKLIRANQEALDLFSRDMLAAQRLQPEESNYSVVIGGCGRGGRLREAFALYNDMKKRGLQPSDATYTALFNACAESRRQPAGLQRALKLEQDLRRQGCQLSAVTYHALLKVHARHNHLQACLYTLQEMVQQGHAVTPQTFHYLLMACVKDRDAGFRLALQVWRQMLCSGLRPDSQNYNLLLRAARDCALGDPGLASQLLLRPLRTRQDPDSSHKSAPIDVEVLLQQQLLVRAAARPRDAGALISAGQNQDSKFAPNLLDLLEGKRGQVVSLGPVAEAADRLTLIGGAESLLDRMAATGQRPDLRTLTLLADMMEPGPRTMETLLEAAKGHKVKLDTAFFNRAIRRAAKAGALEAAQDVLQLMRQRRVSVDLRTFGSLALGCERPQQALQLLRDVEEAGFKPNLHIFSALIGRATRRLDYVYLKLILKTMRRLEVWPNQLLIGQLEFAARYPPDYDQFKSRNNYLVHIDGFRGYYQQWLREMPAVEADDQQEALQTQSEQRGP